MKAAFVGASEVGFTVLSMSLSLVAVVPAATADGRHCRRLFHEFTITLTVAINDFAGHLADHDADDVRRLLGRTGERSPPRGSSG